MRNIFSIIGIIVILILTGCVSQRVSTIVGCNYDQKNNRTDYFEFPYGTISIPGNWEKTRYNPVSNQQFFSNHDSISIAIAFSRFDKYEFNTNGDHKGYDFVKAFYEWETEYFFDMFGFNTKVLVNDSIHKFILFQNYGQFEGATFNTYFLFGEKNGNVSNFSVMTTDKWSEDEKVEFLKGLYLKD
ncbi:MAG: hypothetical protein ACNA7V_13980 [Bacteroidales bacterium]